MVARAAWPHVRVMRHTTSCLISMVLLAPAVPAEQRTIINLYDLAGLPLPIREEMKRETSKIFLQAGASLEWVDCEIAGKPLNLAECAQPLGAARLMLELIPGTNKKNPRASGKAIIQRGSSVYACLYPDRVRVLARDAGWEFGDLLGHAAAHELGHLLLESAEHSPAGVMRARWETQDLWRLPHDGLVFLPGQLAAVKVNRPTQRAERRMAP